MTDRKAFPMAFPPLLLLPSSLEMNLDLTRSGIGGIELGRVLGRSNGYIDGIADVGRLLFADRFADRTELILILAFRPSPLPSP